MALLVILLPARPRVLASAVAAPAAARATELAWLLSPDGLHIARQGRSSAKRLPAADTVVAVLPPTDVAWHRITCPRAPANRLRDALNGVLEEQLLDEEGQTHLALAPGHTPGQPVWVAATHKPWLQAQLQALADARRPVDRVVPALAPGDKASAHFFTPEGTPTDSAWVALVDTEQALCLPLAGSHGQGLLARWRSVGATLGATPAAAAEAERALGGPVQIRSDAEQGLAALHGKWQLLQFDLAPSRRGMRALGSLMKQLRTPAWRPVRWGLAALSLVQLLGLNAYAWQLERGVAQKRQDMVDLLRSAHPQVRAVLDVPVQMRRETELLREAAGVPGDNDFETLLGAMTQAWPDGQGPAPQLRFEPGQVSLPASSWAPQQIEQFRNRLQAGGWSAEQADGRLTVRRATRPSR